jgi:hypothetical protein
LHAHHVVKQAPGVELGSLEVVKQSFGLLIFSQVSTLNKPFSQFFVCSILSLKLFVFSLLVKISSSFNLTGNRNF